MSVKNNTLNYYYKIFKHYPDLNNPISFNYKIQWLKLFDQTNDHITCVDKKAVKGWVESRIKGITIPPANTYPEVWKTTHDAGSVQFVNNETDAQKAYRKLNKKLKRSYGFRKGEWAYSFVKPEIIKEKRIDNGDVDYKFHCCNGEVKWLQMIWDRFDGNIKECIFDSKGHATDLHLDNKLTHSKRDLFCTRDNFFELKRIAELLSKEWKYVRVDLYWAEKQPWFGELTFWPAAGCYPKNKDNIIFGKMLDFDITTKKDKIIE